MAGHRDRFGGQFGQVLAAARRGGRWDGADLRRARLRVTGYLRAQGGAEPADLTSEVFLAVLRNLQRFDGDEPAFR